MSVFWALGAGVAALVAAWEAGCDNWGPATFLMTCANGLLLLSGLP